MPDSGRIRENNENNENASERPSHDLLRARACERQAAGESSSVRNEHSDRGRFPSSEQEVHLDPAGLDLPPTMVTIEKYISEHDKKLWEKQCSENLMRLDAQTTLPEMNQQKKDTWIRVIQKSGDYFKENLTKVLDDWALHQQQISERTKVEWVARAKANGLAYPTEDPEVEAYYAKRGQQLDKQWGEVIKEWAENYNWITKDRICITRGDLGVPKVFDNIFNYKNDHLYERYQQIEFKIHRLIPDHIECSRLFAMRFAYFSYFPKKSDQ